MVTVKKVISASLSAVLVLTSLFMGAVIFQPTNAKALDFIKDQPVKANKKKLPEVKTVTAISNKIIAIKIQEGFGIPSKVTKYVAKKGDEITFVEQGEYKIKQTFLNRNGDAGRIITNSKGERFLKSYASFTEARANYDNKAKTYSLKSKNDKNYSSKKKVVAKSVSIKRKPNGSTFINAGKFTYETYLYINFPKAMKVGKKYTIGLSKLGTYNKSVTFVYQPTKMRSDAVHVNQVGFRADDPAKVASVSLWMGSKGKLQLPNSIKFQILDNKTRKKVFSGTGYTTFKSNTPEIYEDKNGKTRNLNNTDVCNLDFSSLTKKGSYVVYVPGYGCSYPFTIGDGTWQAAFKISMKGFLHQRSGMAITTKFGDYNRPIGYSPKDGFKVYQAGSVGNLADTGDGLYAVGTSYMMITNDNFNLLVKGWKDNGSDKIAVDVNGDPNGCYGGYFDAGDFDRRAQHLEATRYQLELLLMYPRYFENLKLSLPENEAKDNLPDILNEMLWNADFYRRMATPEGGIRGGIESIQHPVSGETSWTESLQAIAYYPDAWSSFLYAQVGAGIAYYLESVAPANVRAEYATTAKLFRDSSIKAYAWGTTDLTRRLDNEIGKIGGNQKYTATSNNTIAEEKTTAATYLFMLTHEAQYNDYVLAANRPALGASAFIYALLPTTIADAKFQKRCVNNLTKQADALIKLCDGNAYNLVRLNEREYISGTNAFYTDPNSFNLVRVHYLTGVEKYLTAAIKSCQLVMGSNQMNLSYMTGLGKNPVKGPLLVDVIEGGLPTPSGIVVFGNVSVLDVSDKYFIDTFAPGMYPKYTSWPVSETYVDVNTLPNQNEFIINTLTGTNYLFGYLAARGNALDNKSPLYPPKQEVYEDPIAPGNGNGLLGEYYKGNNLSAADVTSLTKVGQRIDSNINFSWGTDVEPMAGTGKDYYTVKWTGKITARVTGRHIFTCASDDGIVVRVGGVDVINQWRPMAVHSGLQSGEIVMEKGKTYTFEMYYFEQTGLSSCKLSWEGPGMAEDVIPQSQFNTPDSGPAVSTLPDQDLY